MQTEKQRPFPLPTNFQRIMGHYRNMFLPNLRSLYYNLILNQLEQPWWRSFPPVSYYEFGVGKGQTLTNFLRAAKDVIGREALPRIPVALFDTFSGLPEAKSSSDLSPMWRKGLFAHSESEIEDIIRRTGTNPKGGNVKFVAGEYSQTLNAELRATMASMPPSLVTVDVDYYSSAKMVLDWIAPLLHDGTIFYFDDVDYYYGNPEYGELKAINEFNQSGIGLLTKLYQWIPSRYFGRVYIYSQKSFGEGWFDPGR